MGAGTYGRVLKNCYVNLNGTDISKYVREVHLSAQYADVDATGMGTGAMEHETGLYSGTISLVAKSNFGAASIHETLWPLFNGEDDFTVKINPGPLPTSESNPQFQATCRLLNYAPIDAALGGLMTNPITLTVQDKITEVYT